MTPEKFYRWEDVWRSTLRPPPPPLTYEQEVLADGPLAYWPLDESSGTDMLDGSANDRHGTYVNGPTLGQPSIIPTTTDTAVRVDGTSQHGLVTAAAWNNLTDLTFEVVVEFEAVFVEGVAGKFGGSGSTYVWGLKVAFGSLQADKWSSGGTKVTIETPVEVDTPYHIAFTIEAGVAQSLYVNGVLKDSTEHGTLRSSSQSVWLGREPGGAYGQEILQGAALHGSALSAERILAHAEAAGLAA